jgi:hypothetical protein
MEYNYAWEGLYDAKKAANRTPLLIISILSRNYYTVTYVLWLFSELRRSQSSDLVPRLQPILQMKEAT